MGPGSRVVRREGVLIVLREWLAHRPLRVTPPRWLALALL